MQTISIHGASGSIGLNAIDIIQRNPHRFQVEVLIGGSDVDKLAAIAKGVNAKHVAIADSTKYQALKEHLPGAHIYAGPAGILEAASINVDICLAAITGAAGLLPTYTALSYCKRLALANKESIVAAGEQVMAKAQACGTQILPVDSEHSALFQIFDEYQRSALRNVTITASGGPFRTWSKDQFATINKSMALKHPNWSMGPKVTIDCATLMNKGLEYIEAVLLFKLAPDQVKVIVHPQSIIHALSSYEDGTTLAHLGMPDMRTPISYALSWPQRIKTPVAPLDLASIATLSFEAPDYDRFPCLQMAEAAMKDSQAARIIMNAANEVAVKKFLAEEIHFTEIPVLIQKFLDNVPLCPINSIEDVIALDHDCRVS
ncbi:1-deoxy-D-xylulose-5-phosphate reductoisomerase [Candidatus Odyssella thessalonicensis]|uniref:1-deoxy-D-xylulose-5-phosphate reductoisomerase n=1 Tax=Candidatus Odyssella thessalonicensis TaxID=84647 RepID=UPI000225AEAF|nr:1-deoxy-D-xylulose-5-phosphate reductoisomerase [Candidatus Odyssella thessalonicensis]